MCDVEVVIVAEGVCASAVVAQVGVGSAGVAASAEVCGGCSAGLQEEQKVHGLLACCCFHSTSHAHLDQENERPD